MIKIIKAYLTIWWHRIRYGQKYPIADPNGPICGIYNVETKKVIWTHHKPDLELEEAVLGTQKLLDKMEKY